MTVLRDLGAVRESLGRGLFGMVAGPDGPANRSRIHDTPGPRWFDNDRPIRRVHGDAAMFVGGLRALLLQSLHPLALRSGCGSPCPRWPGRASPSTPTTAAIRGGGCSAPAHSWR